MPPEPDCPEILPAGLWRRDRSLAALTPARLAGLRLFSCDVFNTLIFRLVAEPADLFAIVGKRARAAQLLPADWTAAAFRQARVLAEPAARLARQSASGTTEITLDDIYATFPAPLDTPVRTALAQLEIAVESEFTCVNPSLLSLLAELRTRNIPMVLVSDMYLTPGAMRAVLAAAGVPDTLYSGLLVSCAHGADKRSGKLFNSLKAAYPDIAPAAMLHLGDDAAADIAGAGLADIPALLYTSLTSLPGGAIAAEDAATGPLLPGLRALRLLAAATTGDSAYAARGAEVMGPFLALFAEWLATRCREEKITAVYALMREGRLLAELLRRATRRGCASEIKLLWISRTAAEPAGWKTIDRAVLEDIFAWRGLTVSELFSWLELDLAGRFTPYANVPLSSCAARAVGASTLKEAIIAFLLEPEQQELLRGFCARRRELLLHYLRQETAGGRSVATVDFGYHGTIQLVLQKTLELAGTGRAMQHFLAASAPLPRAPDLRSFIGGGEHDIAALLRSPEPLEVQLIADDGCTLGYAEQPDGGVRPVTAPNLCQADHDKIAQLHDGILWFQQLWLWFSARRPETAAKAAAARAETAQLLCRQVEFPTLREAELLGALLHENNRGRQQAVPVCSDADAARLRDMGPERFLAAAMPGHSLLGVCWPQGVVTRQFPDWLLQHRTAGGPDRHCRLLMEELAAHIVAGGERRIIIFGAGETGQALRLAAADADLAVAGFVESQVVSPGGQVDGCPVLPLAAVVAGDLHVFAVGSLARVAEMTHTLRVAYRGQPEPRIYSVDSLFPAAVGDAQA